MDLVTHGLASLAVARGFFPRAGKVVALSTIAVGIAADVDWFSAYGGPSSFLAGYRTTIHSIVAALLFSVVLVVLLAFLAQRWGGLMIPLGTLEKGETIPEEAAARRRFAVRRILAYVLGAPVCAAVLHIAMDACQSDGVMLLWPFSSRRFALDWLPGLDPWILTILVACIAVPELLHLVSSEIGAKSKRPRGQAGALIGLALVVVYIGVRGTLHSSVVTAMESRTFHGEAARRASAFPESLSLFTWHGTAETESALNQVEVNAGSTATFDADNSLRFFKPQDSPALNAAKNTSVAKRFLATAQIPKASVEKTEAGYRVVIRDLRYAASGETAREIAALIELDLNNRVTSQELLWARDLPR